MNWALKLQGRRRNSQELVLFGLEANFSAQDVRRFNCGQTDNHTYFCWLL